MGHDKSKTLDPLKEGVENPVKGTTLEGTGGGTTLDGTTSVEKTNHGATLEGTGGGTTHAGGKGKDGPQMTQPGVLPAGIPPHLAQLHALHQAGHGLAGEELEPAYEVDDAKPPETMQEHALQKLRKHLAPGQPAPPEMKQAAVAVERAGAMLQNWVRLRQGLAREEPEIHTYLKHCHPRGPTEEAAGEEEGGLEKGDDGTKEEVGAGDVAGGAKTKTKGHAKGTKDENEDPLEKAEKEAEGEGAETQAIEYDCKQLKVPTSLKVARLAASVAYWQFDRLLDIAEHKVAHALEAMATQA